jgi:hypothetical protein
VLLRDLLEEVREDKRRKLARFKECEYAIDTIFLPEVGHLRPIQCGPDRCARLIRELADGKITGNPLGDASIRKYLSPLSAAFRKAVRRAIIPVNPLAQLS